MTHDRRPSDDSRPAGVGGEEVDQARYQIELLHEVGTTRASYLSLLLIITLGSALGAVSVRFLEPLVFRLPVDVQMQIGRQGIVDAAGWKITLISLGLLSLGFGLAMFLFRRIRERESRDLQTRCVELTARAAALAEQFRRYEQRKADVRPS